jgi:hypothetical protein
MGILDSDIDDDRIDRKRGDLWREVSAVCLLSRDAPVFVLDE